MSIKRHPQEHYRVGIDLGTTHIAVAYQSIDDEAGAPALFPVTQLTAPGEVNERPLLPAVRYHPAEDEITADACTLPWPLQSTDTPYVVGEIARRLGARTQGRLITSAKSWLSHDGVDRLAPILPWAASSEVRKISPLDATISYLQHVRAAWNQAFSAAPLEQQQITITIPASFDEIARNLTLDAARRAGLQKLQLLEEPQAAGYDWLWQNRQHLQQTLKDVKLLLVCDIGGGTSDFTLIRVEPGSPYPGLTRIGVGHHLMLGGDNIDLALAYQLEDAIRGDKELSASDFAQLVEQCRHAKEKLLSDQELEQTQVTILGTGSRLFGNTRSATLTRQAVLEVVLDGFFPLSDVSQMPETRRSGFVATGLPYAQDPAVSHHLAAFLATHRKACQEALGLTDGVAMPDAVLLNGSPFLSPVIQARMVELLSQWRNSPIQLLDNPRPGQAVAFGAVAYANAKVDAQLKIGGGSARSYFLLIDSFDDSGQKQAVCLLPQGSEEETEVRLHDRQFSLQLGQPVSFHLVTRIDSSGCKAGDVQIFDAEHFQVLPPLVLQLNADSQTEVNEIRVELSCQLSSVGTLQVQCVAIEDNSQRWDVEFQLRGRQLEQTIENASQTPGITEAVELIGQIFGKKSRDLSPKAIKTLRADLEQQLGPRDDWSTPVLRQLFQALWDGHKFRRRSANHERIWFSLAGYCLRPGYGYPGDEWRIQNLWGLYSQSLQFVNETQVWAEWWTLWRRVAGGLDEIQQQKLFADVKTFINPVTAKQGKNAALAKSRSYDNMVRLVGSLEQLAIADKQQLGKWLLARLDKASETPQSWWALGRIGARTPYHGSDNKVLPADIVAQWVDVILKKNWKNNPQIAFAAVQLTRVCGDRVRDLPEELRQRVITQLNQNKASATWIAMVSELTELDEVEEQRIFGDALPSGLRLITH